MATQHRNIVDTLETNYSAILAEYKNLRVSQTKEHYGITSDYVVDDQKLHTGKWDWQSYMLKGKRQASFAANCPKTAAVLESLSFKSIGSLGDTKSRAALMTNTPLSFAFFSTMGPGAEIRPHYGASNIRIRCHLPLIVPKGDIGMIAGGSALHWQEGKPLFFDDSYEHQVWNRTSSDRVVLLFDLWHPELEMEEISALQDMFSYAQKQGWNELKAEQQKNTERNA